MAKIPLSLRASARPRLAVRFNERVGRGFLSVYRFTQPAGWFIPYNLYFFLSSKGIEPFTAVNQFFYREPPLPIGSPALKKSKIV